MVRLSPEFKAHSNLLCLFV